MCTVNGVRWRDWPKPHVSATTSYLTFFAFCLASAIIATTLGDTGCEIARLIDGWMSCALDPGGPCMTLYLSACCGQNKRGDESRKRRCASQLVPRSTAVMLLLCFAFACLYRLVVPRRGRMAIRGRDATWTASDAAAQQREHE